MTRSSSTLVLCLPLLLATMMADPGVDAATLELVIAPTGAVGDNLGRRVSNAGDVNGDGFDDLIVGAQGNDAGGSSAGRAYVYYGGPGADATADLTFTGEAAGDFFGYSVSTAGDVNGDGFDDLIVGAYWNDAGGSNAGRAYLYYGGPGADAIADLTFTGEASLDKFGASVSTAGDVNGDGFDDLIVGASNNDAGGATAGRAYVYFGGPSADATADLTFTGEAVGDDLGFSVSAAGDVNGDGFDDLIVGAYQNDAGGSDAGQAYVYFGGPSVDATADLTFTGEAVGDLLGFSVSTAGDVNGDGFDDLIVGAYDNDAGGLASGRAYVYFGGPGADATADLIVTGEAAGDHFGISVSTAGDFNGDGFDDLIVGAYWNDAGGSDAGRAYVYSIIPIQLQSPNGGEQWVTGSKETIEWSGAGAATVELSIDGGFTYSVLATSVATPGEGSLEIPVPATTSDFALIRVSETGAALKVGAAADVSDNVFRIVEQRVLPWELYMVDDDGDAGLWTSLELGAGDEPHISYYDNTTYDLRYARRLGGVWVVDVVDATGITGRYSSLALDTQGNPHISYNDVTDFDLEYAVKTGGTWTIEKVDVTGQKGRYTSLALDSGDDPHITYRDEDTSGLKYAVRSGGSWSTEVVHTGVNSYWTSLVLDSHGSPHIAYDAASLGYLLYAEKTSGSWAVDTVDASGTVGSHFSIALDEVGTPHISYYDQSSGDLKLAVKKNASWSIETVDSNNDVGRETSLALGTNGVPHISYRDATDGDLKYAAKTGGRWSTTVLDTTGNVGIYTSIEIDDHDLPRISYYDYTNGRVKYASPSIHVVSPGGGATWPVGSSRSVTWGGRGAVDIFLSVDGGASQLRLATGVADGEFDLIVPHTPSRFCLVRIERNEAENDFGSFVYANASAESDSFFTIETSVELLMLLVSSPSSGPGLVVSWSTDPGPEDLRGYCLEKSSRGGEYVKLVSRTTETTYHDTEGRDGDRYRLFAINGLGDEILLGETVLTPRAALSAWPLPYRGGELNITFATFGGLGGGSGPAEVSVFDLNGRLVRNLVRGDFEAGLQAAAWDGRDSSGRPVSSGVYFLRASSAGENAHIKIVVAP